MSIRVWISRYALSEGVYPVEVPDNVELENNNYLSFITEDPLRYHSYGKQDWHLTRERALKRADAMRDAKIKSIERQIARLRALQFGDGS